MDESLKKEAMQWLTSLRESTGRATAFALDRAPDAVRELVFAGRLESTLGFLGGVVVIAIAALAVRQQRQRLATPDLSTDDAIAATLGLLAAVAVGLVGVAIVSSAWHDLATSWFAPRIHVVERLGQLVGR